jgi:hypothetical protein
MQDFFHGWCPNLECDDLSSLWSLRPVAGRSKKALITQCGVQPPQAKAVTGHRTPN